MIRTLWTLPLAVLLLAAGSDFDEAWGGQQNVLTPSEASEGWMLLFDGQTTAGWAPRGEAKWQVQDGTISPVPDSGRGFMATSTEYASFHLKVDFWIDDVANSGVFVRSPTSGRITQKTAYEVNIFDPHDSWPTGSINEVAKIQTMPNTAGKWNTFEITADGDHLMVKLNGETTVDARDQRHARGPIGLQYNGSGQVKFRNVKIRTIG